MKHFFAVRAAALIMIAACTGPDSPQPNSPPSPTEPIPAPKYPAPTVSLHLTGSPVIGTRLTVAWTSTSSTHCQNNWSLRTTSAGTDTVMISGSRWFRISCMGLGGEVRDSAWLEASDPLPQAVTVRVLVSYLGLSNTNRNTTMMLVGERDTSRWNSTSESGVVVPPGDTIRVEIAGNASYFPVITRIPKEVIPDTLHIIRIPRTWVVERGEFKGRSVAVSLIAAYAVSEQTRDTSSLFRRSSLKSFGLTGWYRYFHLGWDEGRFPIPVVLTGVDGVTATMQDSVDLWRGIAWLHSRLGRVVFRPGTRTETPRIDVELDDSNRAFGGMVFGPSGEAVRGVYLASRSAIQMFGGFATIHELLHAVGFGHTCSWGSVMRSCGDTNFSPTIVWTEPWKDVVYFDLWHSLGALRRQSGHRTLTLHLGESLNGERREWGLPEERVFYGDPWELNRN